MSLPGPSVIKGRALPLGGLTVARQSANARPRPQLGKQKVPAAGAAPPPPAVPGGVPLPPPPTSEAPGGGGDAPPAPSVVAAPALVPAPAVDRIADAHKRANEMFAGGKFHEAVPLYQSAIERCASDSATASKHLFATLQSNLAATFIRLQHYQEATVAARAAVNAFAQTAAGPNAKAFYRLMQGLEGQRLLPEAVAVGMHAISIIDNVIATSHSPGELTEEGRAAGAGTTTDGPSRSQLMASRKQLVQLLERIHAQTVGKPKTASDSLVSTAKVDARSTMLARSEELSRRILGLGVYAKSPDAAGLDVSQEGMGESGQAEKENNAGVASMESRVNVADTRFMENSAKHANPDAFAPVSLEDLQKQLHGYRLCLLSDDPSDDLGSGGDRKNSNATSSGIYCAKSFAKGDVLFCDMSPVVVTGWGKSVAALSASDALDRGACSVLETLWKRSVLGFSLAVRRLFAFYPPNAARAQALSNPFAPENRAVFRDFSQELACQSFGSDNMSCLKNYASQLQGSTSSGNPLAAILLCLHCIRHALQPFRIGQDDAGLVVALGCPVRPANAAAGATVTFEVDHAESLESCVVRLVAARDIEEGSELLALFLGTIEETRQVS